MTRLRSEPRHLVLALAVIALPARAQQSEPASGMLVQPRISLSQAWTDNLNLQANDKDAALITTVSPGIRIASNGGSVRGMLDYTLNGIAYAKSNQPSRLQNALTANGQAEIVPQTFLVDAQASIGQESASAFGLQAPPTMDAQGGISTLANANRRETGTLSISPLLRGPLGGAALVELRGNAAVTEVRGSSLGDGHSQGMTLRVSQLNPGRLGWYMLASTQRASYAGAPSNRSSSVVAGGNYRPDPDWAFSANAGHESNDYLGGDGGMRKGFTGGVTADWSPSPRTHLGSNWQKHRYGDNHGLSFEHRMAHAVWRLSDSSSVVLGNAGVNGGLRTNYQLYYLLSQEPDPVKRDLLVRSFLQSAGLSPDAPSSTGFLSTGPSRMHNQMLSFALQGVRTSVTALLSRVLTSRLGNGLNQGDLASNSRIEQRSYSLSGSYRLTPVSGIALTATRQETSGDSTSTRSQLTSLTANWNAHLSRRLSVQLGARHGRFEGVTSYSENAAYANLTQQF